MTPIQPQYLSLKQTAEFLGFSQSFVEHNYPQWLEFGVVARRRNNNPNSNLMFKISELEKMVDEWRVVAV